MCPFHDSREGAYLSLFKITTRPLKNRSPAPKIKSRHMKLKIDTDTK